MKAYLDIVRSILEAPEDAWKPNRTGVRSKGISGAMFQHDMGQGFPLLTTKRMPIKTIAAELEFFLRGLDDKRWLQARNCHIWDEWCSPAKVPYGTDPETRARMAAEPDLGPIYGVQWVSWEPSPNQVVRVRARQAECGVSPLDAEALIARTPLTRASHPLDQQLFNLWCYTLRHTCRKQGEGLWRYALCQDWLDFATFRTQVRLAPNWRKKEKYPREYRLESIYYGSDVLAPHTAVWMTNAEYIVCVTSKPFLVISPDGEERLYLSLSRASEDTLFSERKIAARLSGKEVSHPLGYDYRSVEQEAGVLYRYALPINQVEGIVQTLKTDPSSRRMICSAWRPDHLAAQALPPCHLLWEVVVTGEKLDTLNLIWYQRSVDVALGLPFNIASYGLLMTLLAKETGMKLGTLTGMLGDVHIYENHVAGLEEQLRREPLPLPKLEIPDFNSLFDWTCQQVKLLDYQHHGRIDFEVAV